MAATKGNQWWKLATKMGRKKLFSSPSILWGECVKYFEATDKRKWHKEDFIKSGDFAGNKVFLETETPYTLSGLCLFLKIDRQTWENYAKKEQYKEFFEVCSRVHDIIYTQKIEGASVGAFNPSIVAMELGLKAKHEIETNERKNVADLFPPFDETGKS